MNLLKKRIYSVLPLIVIILVWVSLFIFSDIFNAKFNYFMDDWQIIDNHGKLNNFNDILIQPFADLFSSTRKMRFRPIYDVLWRFFPYFYGLNPFVWYLSNFLAATVTTSLFYFIARRLSFSVLESIFFSAIAIIGEQSTTYARFGTPETTATFFLVLALLCGSLNISHRKLQLASDILFVLFGLLASLDKEACLLMLPALIFFKIWIFSRNHGVSIQQSIEKNKTIIALISIFFFLSVAYIALYVTGPGYAGIDQDTLSIEKYVNILNKNDFKLAIVINLIYLLILKLRHKVKSFINGYILFSLLVIIPQIVLYSKSGLDNHYYLPASIGVALLVVYPLKIIRQYSGFGYKLLSLGLVLTIILRINNEFILVDNYFHRVSPYTNNLHEVMVKTSQCAGQDSKLVIFANPYTNYEMIYAFNVVVNQMLKNNQYYLATYGSQKSDFITDAMKTEEKRWLFLNPQEFDSVYIGHRLKDLSSAELINVKGVLVAHSSKVELDLNQKFGLYWFKSGSFTRYHNQDNDFSLYCKSEVSDFDDALKTVKQ